MRCLLQTPATLLVDLTSRVPADLNGADWDCCPTRVIPGTFRACRQPNYKEIPGETSWQGRTPLAAIAQPGDVLLFRSGACRRSPRALCSADAASTAVADVWHSGGNNVTENTTRLVVEAAYGARRVSQKFW